jgi:Ca-activated chloride channel family protein
VKIPHRIPASLILAAAILSAAPQKDEQDVSFKVDVSLVTLLVNVKDARGAPIGDLEKEDFTIVDGGVPREISVFETRTNRPLSVALMIDTSLSAAKELPFERDAAKRFLQNLLGDGSSPQDRVAILQFSDYVDMLVNFTRSLNRLSRALEQTRADSGTSLYDTVLLGSQILQRREGRRVMVLITDGGDTTSRIPFGEALQGAHGVDAVIYGIIVVPIQSDAGRNVGGENALKTLAAGTGGETYIQYGTADLDQAFQEILRNLRTQYLIAYYPPPVSSRERFRATEVRVNRPGARVLSRNGYFVPDEESRPVTPTGRPSVRPRPRP